MNIRASATLLLIASLSGTTVMVSQNRSDEPIVTRTFELNGISSKDAAQLIGPYAMGAQGWVFEAGTIRAVTVRGPASLIRTADSLLQVFDSRPVMVTLRFKLLAPSDRPGTVGELSDVEQELNQIFGTTGYRVVGEATARVGERNSYSVTMSSETGRVHLSGTLGRLMKGSGEPSIGMTLSARSLPSMVTLDTTQTQMAALAEMMNSREFIDTGMTIPVGHTLVLGAGGSAEAGALVLVVKPEI